jgi:hypothetical protein
MKFKQNSFNREFICLLDYHVFLLYLQVSMSDRAGPMILSIGNRYHLLSTAQYLVIVPMLTNRRFLYKCMQIIDILNNTFTMIVTY